MTHPALRGVVADIHPTADLGEGTVVWSFASVLAGVKTGRHCAIGCHAYIGRDRGKRTSRHVHAEAHAIADAIRRRGEPPTAAHGLGPSA